MIKRIRNWIRRTIERAFNRYAEGPDPPARYAQAVLAFATLNPSATQEDWIKFAADHAHECYRSGYLRGVEWKERTPERRDVAVGVALLEAESRHGWSWVDLAPAEEQLAEIVRTHPEMIERLSPEERVFYMDRIGRTMGGFRVDLIPSNDPKQR